MPRRQFNQVFIVLSLFRGLDSDDKNCTLAKLPINQTIIFAKAFPYSKTSRCSKFVNLAV